MAGDSAAPRWDAARAKRASHTTSARDWRCLRPGCNTHLVDRIGYCSDSCSSQHRAVLFEQYMAARYGKDWRTDGES